MLIVCNGMMRSGSTLQYNIARTLAEKTGTGIGQGFFTDDQLTNLGERLLQWGKEQNYYVIKTHDFNPNVAEMTSAGLAKVFYIYRDIRDVAASAKRKFGSKGVRDLVTGLDRVIDVHYRIKAMDNVLWQKYEDVVADNTSAIWAQADSLKLQPTEDIVSEVAKECSLENADRIGRSLQKALGVKVKSLLRSGAGIPINIYDKYTLLHPDHISRNAGAIGAWRTELTDQETCIITERYRLWLHDEGYPLQ